MTYKETLEFLFSQLPAYHRIGKAAYKGNLDITVALDNYFGHPHRNYRSIHIAGTNGKGSVSHLMASVLQEAGFKTGLYTSPHLRDFRERIRVNGQMIPESSVIDFTQNHRSVFEKLKPSFFEMTVAMALDYFAMQSVDVAVIEVGLGGRLDSTNIITPVLSLITNIGHDHMDLLGDTPEKIAYEKAGIIKRNVPVIISETQPEVKNVFLTRAAEAGSAISFADTLFSCIFDEYQSLNGSRKYWMRDLVNHSESEGLSVLCGDYQSRNLQAVFSAFSNLQSLFPVSSRHLTDGIRNVIQNTGFAGRWHILNHQPLIICDTGHNMEGLELVTGQIRKIPKSSLHMILGFVNDKDLGSVMPLFPLDATYYFTKASVPRAMDEKILLARAEAYGLKGAAYPDVKSALLKALESAEKNDVIFVGGSTFIVAEVV
jgi:dihydrofolate synthase / folylpolyglutamate synthase